MTHVSPSDRAGSVPPRAPQETPPKAALFCPRCGHESPADGDWVLTLCSEAVEVRCPDCRCLLTTRPDWLAAKERSAGSR